MKILIVNKYHYMRGGDCKASFELGTLLKNHNQEIRYFSMKHPKNFEYVHSNDFVSYIDFPEEFTKGSKLKVIKRMLYSKESRLKFRKIIREFKPDIIHLHNIHKHLTSSIILEANKNRIPIVWTLHDYNLICPNISLLNRNDICERCKNFSLSPVVMKCNDNSISKSAIITIENILHKFQNIKHRINKFISPSYFLKAKFIEFKYSSNIEVLPNFYEANIPKMRDTSRKYFLYFGRISKEKGISTLCEAAKISDISLVIAGTGPLLDELKNLYQSSKINFVGFKSGIELENLRRNAFFVIVPSEWYENNPFSILESFADRVPAIGANIGGIPELIREEKTGLLFESKNVMDLSEKLNIVKEMSEEHRNMLGENAYNLIKQEHDPERYYNKLMEIYNKAIEEEKTKWKRS